MLTRTAIGAISLLSAACWAEPTCAGSSVYIEVHGLDISWNRKPLAGYLALRLQCKAQHSQLVEAKFTVASGIDTSRPQMDRIIKILREDCGASRNIVYDVLVHVGR